MLYILLDALFPVMAVIREVPHWSIDEALAEAGDLTEIISTKPFHPDDLETVKCSKRFPEASWRAATELRPQVGDLIYLLPTAQMYLVEGKS